jgi:RNA polymerase sigma factor (sigma-70 family)
MPRSVADSAEVAIFLAAGDEPAREAAWERLISRYTRLVLHVSRSFGGGYDAVMDRYEYVLERLREDDFRRVRGFRLDGSAAFPTWLVVVARRLCLDHHRRENGRAPIDDPRGNGVARLFRWRLTRNHGERIDPDTIADAGSIPIDQAVGGADPEGTLQSAVASLPDRDRLLLLLRFEQALPASRIAKSMGFPTVFHVYRRLAAVTAALRIELERNGVEGRGS